MKYLSSMTRLIYFYRLKESYLQQCHVFELHMQACESSQGATWQFLSIYLSSIVPLASVVFMFREAGWENTSAWIGSSVPRVRGLCARTFVFTHLIGTVHTLSVHGDMTLSGCQVPSKGTMSPPSRAGQGRENVTEGSGAGIGAGRNHSSITDMGERLRFGLSLLINHACHKHTLWTNRLGKWVEFITSQNQTSIRRSKPNLNNTDTFTPHLLFPRPICIPASLPSPTAWFMEIGSRGYGQFITGCYCLCFLLRERRPLPASLWGPSHGWKSSTNFSNVSPSHGLQFFRNRQFQCWSSGRSKFLPGNLLQHGLLSPLFSLHSSTIPAKVQLQVSHRITAGFYISKTLFQSGGPPWAAHASLCTTDFHGLQRHSYFTMVFISACREISALAHAALPPPPSALTLELAELFCLHVLTPLLWLQLHLSNNFSSFLNMLSQRIYYHHCLAWLWTTTGQFLQVLAPLEMKEASTNFSKKPSL